MIAAATSPLVAGGRPAPAAPIVDVRVLRPFLVKGQRVEVGAVLQVPRSLAAELANAGKAEMIARPAAAAVNAGAGVAPAGKTFTPTKPKES